MKPIFKKKVLPATCYQATEESPRSWGRSALSAGLAAAWTRAGIPGAGAKRRVQGGPSSLCFGVFSACGTVSPRCSKARGGSPKVDVGGCKESCHTSTNCCYTISKFGATPGGGVKGEPEMHRTQDLSSRSCSQLQRASFLMLKSKFQLVHAWCGSTNPMRQESQNLRCSTFHASTNTPGE